MKRAELGFVERGCSDCNGNGVQLTRRPHRTGTDGYTESPSRRYAAHVGPAPRLNSMTMIRRQTPTATSGVLSKGECQGATAYAKRSRFCRRAHRVSTWASAHRVTSKPMSNLCARSLMPCCYRHVGCAQPPKTKYSERVSCCPKDGGNPRCGQSATGEFIAAQYQSVELVTVSSSRNISQETGSSATAKC